MRRPCRKSADALLVSKSGLPGAPYRVLTLRSMPLGTTGQPRFRILRKTIWPPFGRVAEMRFGIGIPGGEGGEVSGSVRGGGCNFRFGVI